jgi:hypothetical protein
MEMKQRTKYEEQSSKNEKARAKQRGTSLVLKFFGSRPFELARAV